MQHFREQFGDERFDAIFHLASITDTTLHDQFVQVHDNVRARRLLNFAQPNQTRIIFASSASTYGAASSASVESNGAAPANVYAFQIGSWTMSAPWRGAEEFPDWIIVGLRYLNVSDRARRTRASASGRFRLAKQMKAGKRPRIFKHREQQRDFVYVKVSCSIRALDANESTYNLGCGKARSFNELVDVLNQCLNTKFQPDYFDNPHAHYQNFTQADLTKVRGALGYEPQYPLESGIANYLKWLYPASHKLLKQ